MSKAASEVMQSIIIAAVTEAIEALKGGAKGMPNNLLRDLQSIHPNASFTDLPKSLQDSINLSARAAFTKLSKDGYSVTPTSMAPQSRPMDRVPERQRSGPGDRRGPPRTPGRGPGGGRAPGGGKGAGGGKGPGQGPRSGGKPPRPAR